MADDPWTIRSVAGGWQLFYKGQPWPMEPKLTDQSAAAYLERVKKRYRGDSARLLLEADEPETKRTRGGPWRYTYPNGEGQETGVIHTRRKSDAKQVLRAQLETQRLPNGITWMIEA